jgi:hypothetical protein
MGEGPDKMNADDARVVHLREQIASKRAALSLELDELRRRRELAMANGRRLLKAAGVGAVGVVVLGSLTNAVVDLFMSEDENEKRTKKAEAESSGIGIIGLAMFAARWAAKEYVRYKLTERKERLRSDRNWEAKYGQSSGNGNLHSDGNGDLRAHAPS